MRNPGRDLARSAHETAEVISHGSTVGAGGLTDPGCPQAVPRALAERHSGTERIAEVSEPVEVVLETVVRCTEIDDNGHLNNAKYVEYLEWGREEWYDRQGFAYDRLRDLGAITVVVNLNVNFHEPCRQGDQLRIITWPQHHRHTSFVLAQRIERADGTVVGDAIVTLVTVDPNTRLARLLPEKFARLFPTMTEPLKGKVRP